jgi:hypothetical protein
MCRNEDGYAALAALVLTAALSLGLTAALMAAGTERMRAQRAFVAAVRDEAMNEAVMRYTIDLVNAHDPAPATYRIGAIDVAVTGESEVRKWPVAAAARLTANDLKQKAQSLELSDARTMMAQTLAAQRAQSRLFVLPRNDCFRRLFSPLGLNQPGTTAPTVQGPRTGEVWRFRAEAGPQVREIYARFMGDSHRPYAVLSEETFPRPEEPRCT